jgi:hypothetical protein
MAGEDEIKIVATLDTTDVSNGVQRIQQAVSGVKWDVAEAAGLNPAAGQKIGEDFGESFMSGMGGRILRSMLIRDAIRGMLSTVQEAISNFMGNEERMAGVANSGGFHPLKAIGDWFGTGMTDIADLFPGIHQLGQNSAASNEAAIAAAAAREKQVQAFRDDPSLLKESTSALQSNLSGVIDQRSQAAQQNALTQATEHNSAAAKEAEEQFKSLDKQLAETEAYYRELLGIARQRDRADEEGAKKDAEQREHGFRSAKEAQEWMDGQVREEEAQAKKKQREDELHATELAKRRTELGISASESTVGKDQGAISRDLAFTEKELQHQHATSAVRIGSGVFGRNDSSAALVQHAAQQVSLLRSIDQEIKALRQQHTELTLQ